MLVKKIQAKWESSLTAVQLKWDPPVLTPRQAVLVPHSQEGVQVWWSLKSWFSTVSTFGQYGGLERTDF